MSDPGGLVPLPDVRKAARIPDNRALKVVCTRLGISIVALTSKTKALREEDFKILLAGAWVPDGN